jgi:hypothetical protein
MRLKLAGGFSRINPEPLFSVVLCDKKSGQTVNGDIACRIVTGYNINYWVGTKKYKRKGDDAPKTDAESV